MTSSYVAISSFLLCLASPLFAQDRNTEAQALINQALAEQRILHTCASMHAEGYEILLRAWNENVTEADALLAEFGYSEADRAAFRDASRPASLMLPDDTTFAELRKYCNAHPGWIRQFNTMNFTYLGRALAELR